MRPRPRTVLGVKLVDLGVVGLLQLPELALGRFPFLLEGRPETGVVLLHRPQRRLRPVGRPVRALGKRSRGVGACRGWRGGAGAGGAPGGGGGRTGMQADTAASRARLRWSRSRCWSVSGSASAMAGPGAPGGPGRAAAVVGARAGAMAGGGCPLPSSLLSLSCFCSVLFSYLSLLLDFVTVSFRGGLGPLSQWDTPVVLFPWPIACVYDLGRVSPLLYPVLYSD